MLGAVLREIQFRLLEDGDEVGQTLDLRRTIPKFVRIVEVGKIASCQALICIDERLDDLGVDLVADVAVVLQGDHVLEAGALGNRHRRREVICVPIFVGDVLDEQHEKDIVLVLAGIHAAAQLVA